MDEFELTRQVLKEPAVDPDTRERARAALDRTIRLNTPAARPHRFRVLIAAAAFALVLAALFVTQLAPLGGGSAARAELRHLAAIAAEQPALEPGSGKDLLEHWEEQSIESQADLVSGGSFDVLSRLSVDTSIRADGSGVRRTEVLSSDLASASDRTAWIDAGRPELPQVGDVRLDRFGSNDAPWFDVTHLPTDPDSLEAVLRSGREIPWPTSDDGIFSLIGELLQQGNANPALRSALFEVAARLEGVDLVGTLTDPLGRDGVGLAIDGTGGRTQLIFDEVSSRLLAIEQYPRQADGSIGTLQTWLASKPATLTPEAPASEEPVHRQVQGPRI